MKKLISSLTVFLIFYSLPATVFAIAGACSSHNGVSCSTGMDYDGSVICNDGWKDSTVSYGNADECFNDNIYSTLIELCDLAGENGINLYKTEYKKELSLLMSAYDAHATPLPEPPEYPVSSGGGYADIASCLETTTFTPGTSAESKITYCGNKVSKPLEDYNATYEAYQNERDRLEFAREHYLQYTAHGQAVLKAIDTTGSICSAKLNGTSIITKDESSGLLSDISNYKYATTIKSLQGKSIIEGYSDGTYKPNNKINRAEFTKIVTGSIGNVSQDYNCFPDVKTEWYAPYVCTAKKLGIIDGYPDGSFKPDQSITSAEALKITLEATFDNIPEVDSDYWWQKYTMYANLFGLRPEEWTLPNTEITRGEMAELIYRVQQPLKAII